MSLIVETGTASAASEAYATVAFCDLYHASSGNTLWATLQDTEKEQALRRAATFMCQMYRLQWKGSRVNASQALDWPRYNVQLPDLGVFNVVMPDVVPIVIQQANCELAFAAASGNLNPDATQNIVSKQVGPLKIVYDSNSPQGKRYLSAANMLAPFLQSGSNTMVKLRRV
jgi:hypothetical protein